VPRKARRLAPAGWQRASPAPQLGPRPVRIGGLFFVGRLKFPLGNYGLATSANALCFKATRTRTAGICQYFGNEPSFFLMSHRSSRCHAKWIAEGKCHEPCFKTSSQIFLGQYVQDNAKYCVERIDAETQDLA
jgi:hypothetical protein